MTDKELLELAAEAAGIELIQFKLSRRIIFPHYILKRRKGVRGRAMTLKWRRRLNQGGNT